ncbi:MAG: hypothetical protein ABIR24_12875 [Verrucomicrobiota bacterium]
MKTDHRAALEKQIEVVRSALKKYRAALEQDAADELEIASLTSEIAIEKKSVNPRDPDSVRKLAEKQLKLELLESQNAAADELSASESELKKSLVPIANLIRAVAAPLREAEFQKVFKVGLEHADDSVAGDFANRSQKVRAVEHAASCIFEHAIPLSLSSAADSAINAAQQILEFEK